MGVLILTPVALTLLGRPINSGRQAAELGALLASVAVTCLLMFHPAVSVQSGIVLAAAMIPFVLWGAIRFEACGTAAVVFSSPV
jgi:integral membrane sensor domain MASE1